jgi:threonine-phosphate decarboxylase
MTGHGGIIHLASRVTGIPVGDIIDFSASINPLGVPDSVARAITESIGSLVHYPEPFADQLALRLAAHLGVEAGTVLCGNGSTELIYLTARAFTPGKVLIPAPAFSEYERACRLVPGSVCTGFTLSADGNFDLDPDRFIHALQGCDMAFLCNPNNPTGRLVSKDSVLAIAEAAARQSCYLVVDEAFIDFAPDQSVVRHVAGMSHMIVLRSLTKFYALSGLRIGYAVVPQALVGRMKDHKEPWSINALAQSAGMAAVDDRAYQDRTMQVIRQEKLFLEQELRRIGVGYLPSVPNYYLLRLPKAQDAVAGLRKKGILVRDCSNFDGLDASYIRIAVRSRSENERLLKELSSWAG